LPHASKKNPDFPFRSRIGAGLLILFHFHYVPQCSRGGVICDSDLSRLRQEDRPVQKLQRN
jgi:hypothetical protein